MTLSVTDLKLSFAKAELLVLGLVAWLRFRIAVGPYTFAIDCVALRVTRAGSLVFTFARRRAREDRGHRGLRPFFEPFGPATREALEAALFAQLFAFTPEVRARMAAAGLNASSWNGPVAAETETVARRDRIHVPENSA